MWRFEHKYFFILYAVLVLMCLVFILVSIKRKKILAQLGNLNIVSLIVPNVSPSKRIVKYILYTVSLSFFILGLCGLQTSGKSEEIVEKREGGEIMICLDVSKSMLAEDIKPNRIERAIQAMEKFIDRLSGHRLGIIVFAGNAYVQLPLTNDYSSAKLLLMSISTDMVPKQGTNISEAIAKATESFTDEDGRNKAIVIITDGEDHEESAVKLAEEASEKNIMINTIGVGSSAGVPIPEYRNGVSVGYKKDNQGNAIVTKLNAILLKEIASKGNGVYVQASNADLGLNAVLDKINKLEKKKFDSKTYSDYQDQFAFFFFIAFILLLIEFFINERISQIWKRANLFKE